MKLSALLGLVPGDKVAVVGCGGKTSVIRLLARENGHRPVLIAPTTRMAVAECAALPGVRYLGDVVGEKLVGKPDAEILAACVGCGLSLMEVDGSKRLPLKAWAAHEPVIPSFTTITLGVLPARSLGLPATEKNVHRLQPFLALTGLAEGDPVEECALCRLVMAPGGMFAKAVGRQVLLINQADDGSSMANARRIAQAIVGFQGRILIGSARQGRFEEWRTT